MLRTTLYCQRMARGLLTFRVPLGTKDCDRFQRTVEVGRPRPECRVCPATPGRFVTSRAPSSAASSLMSFGSGSLPTTKSCRICVGGDRQNGMLELQSTGDPLDRRGHGSSHPRRSGWGQGSLERVGVVDRGKRVKNLLGRLIAHRDERDPAPIPWFP